MIRLIEAVMVVMLLLIGILIGAVATQNHYIDDNRALTGQVQDLMAERNGYKQLYETANNGVCTIEYEFPKIKSPSDNDEKKLKME